MPRSLALLVAIALLAPAAAPADEFLVDGIAAHVGSEIVLVSEVMQLVGSTESQARAAGASDQEIAQLRAEALERMIEMRLLEQVVKNAELEATDAEIDATIESIAKENDLSLDALRENVTSQDMSWDVYRGEIRRELERQKVVNTMVARKVRVEEDDVLALYHERFADQPDAGSTVHLRQILMAVPEESGVTQQEVCAQVSELRGRVAAGEPFPELARRHSIAAPERGGDLGWLHVDSMASWMLALIEPLENGELSPVHELQGACTFVQVVESRQFVPVSFEQARARLTDELFQRQLMGHYRDWMEELRSRTYIERSGYFADAASFAEGPRNGSQFESGLSGHDLLRGGSGGAETQ